MKKDGKRRSVKRSLGDVKPPRRTCERRRTSNAEIINVEGINEEERHQLLGDPSVQSFFFLLLVFFSRKKKTPRTQSGFGRWETSRLNDFFFFFSFIIIFCLDRRRAWETGSPWARGPNNLPHRIISSVPYATWNTRWEEEKRRERPSSLCEKTLYIYFQGNRFRLGKLFPIELLVFLPSSSCFSTKMRQYL